MVRFFLWSSLAPFGYTLKIEDVRPTKQLVDQRKIFLTVFLAEASPLISENFCSVTTFDGDGVERYCAKLENWPLARLLIEVGGTGTRMGEDMILLGLETVGELATDGWVKRGN